MKRWLPMLVCAAMLAVPAGAASPWLQPRGDAAASGFQPGGGPAWPDVALSVDLPENVMPRWEPTPLILGDRVLLVAYGNYDAYNGSAQVLSVNVTTGQIDVVAEVAVTSPMTMAATSETLFVGGLRSVHAFELDRGNKVWTWSWEPRTQAERFEVGCSQIALHHGSVTVLCSEDNWEDAGAPEAAGRSVVLAARLDDETGDPQWVREWPNMTRQPTGAVSTDESTEGPSSTTVFPAGLAVSSGRVIVQTIQFTGIEGAGVGGSVGSQPVGAGAGAGQGHIAVRALDAASGEPYWNWTSRDVNITSVFPGIVEPPTDDPSRLPLGIPAATDDAVYVKALKVRKLNLGSGQDQWQREIGSQDFSPDVGGGTGLAYADGEVFTTTAQTVYKLDGENPQRGWSQSLNFTEQQGFNQDPIVTASRVYASTWRPDGAGSVYAFDTEDGDLRWEHQLEGQYLYSFAVSDGLLAYTDVEFFENHVETDLVVLGHTEASPVPRVSVSTTYPDIGEEVQANLSGSEPGLTGPVTRYKAIWGDGNTTGWQDTPTLTHTYAQGGNHTARFVVGTASNQTNSTTVTFHVGQEEPVEPNWVAERFEPENQDMTFGVLGILIAVTGGAIGVARRKRKQATLQKELETLEHGFEDTRDNPGECEAFLETRNARARSLMLDGDLTEEQFGVIESRIDELGRQLRSRVLDTRLEFLPHGMVQSLKKMLADGQISAWERDTFETILEGDDTLSRAQKEKVRVQLDRWMAEDSGGGAR